MYDYQKINILIQAYTFLIRIKSQVISNNKNASTENYLKLKKRAL